MRSPTYWVAAHNGKHEVVESWPAWDRFPAESLVVFEGLDATQANVVCVALNQWSGQQAEAAKIEAAVDAIIVATGGRP